MPDDARILALLKSVTDKTVDALLAMNRGGALNVTTEIIAN